MLSLDGFSSLALSSGFDRSTLTENAFLTNNTLHKYTRLLSCARMIAHQAQVLLDTLSKTGLK